MAPVRALAEGIGASVVWSSEDKSAVVILGGTLIAVSAGNSEMTVNGENRLLITAAVIHEGRLYLPLRQITEALGGTVRWEAEQKTAVISIRDITASYAVNTEIFTNPAPSYTETYPVLEGAMIALTFDDGPSAYTGMILDILKANDSKATFFVLGCNVSRYPDTLRRIADEGSEIGNHSFDHSRLTTLSKEGLDYQINNTQAEIFRITGRRPVLYRPPYGQYNSFVTQNINMAAVLWNVDPEDWKHNDVPMIISGVLDKARDGRIVVMHDTNYNTARAMATVIPALVKRGFRVVTVSEMMNARGIGITPGRIYFSAYEIRDQ